MTPPVRVFAFLIAMFAPTALPAQIDAPGIPSQANPQSQPNVPPHSAGSRAATQDSGGVANENMQAMRDKMFLRRAAEGGIAEVETGKLAAEKGVDEDVRSFGRKMVAEHTELNEEIASTADTLGVILPKKMGKEMQSEYDKLSSLSGEEFDKAYVTHMVKDHHEDLREFRMAAANTANSDLKDAIDKGAAMIRQHMVAIDKIARAKGISVPGHGPKPVAPPAPPTPPTP